MDKNIERLQSILRTMDIPEKRINDWRWLERNMFVRNSRHEHFDEAMGIVRNLLGNQMRGEKK